MIGATGNLDVDDLQLRWAVADLIAVGGPEAVCSVLITLGATRMIRTEIEQLVREVTLLHAPPEGSA